MGPPRAPPRLRTKRAKRPRGRARPPTADPGKRGPSGKSPRSRPGATLVGRPFRPATLATLLKVHEPVSDVPLRECRHRITGYREKAVVGRRCLGGSAGIYRSGGYPGPPGGSSSVSGALGEG